MVSKSKLYTRTGDQGTTALVGGERIAKDNPRLEAYGTVDELNSWLGLVGSDLAALKMPVDFKRLITFIQNKLFDIGGNLATLPGSSSASYTADPVSADDITRLEDAIDQIDAVIPQIRQFVLPAGSEASCRAHIARTVCRRAERRIITLSDISEVDPLIMRFVNRLSDLLFAIARFLNISRGQNEIFWSKDC